jgi:hypothetical protein
MTAPVSSLVSYTLDRGSGLFAATHSPWPKREVRVQFAQELHLAACTRHPSGHKSTRMVGCRRRPSQTRVLFDKPRGSHPRAATQRKHCALKQGAHLARYHDTLSSLSSWTKAAASLSRWPARNASSNTAVRERVGRDSASRATRLSARAS